MKFIKYHNERNLSNILEIGGPIVGDKFSLSLFS
jgi:hypothetical protein